MDGPLDSSSGSSTSGESSDSPKAKKIKVMLNDQDFFAPIGDLEDSLINRRQNFETYVGLSVLFGNKISPEIRKKSKVQQIRRKKSTFLSKFFFLENF